jgi:hypothetical protein
MTAATSATAAVGIQRLRPITERILAALPAPHALWIVVWAFVPWLNAGANLLLDTGERSAIWDQSTALVVLNYAALSLAVVMTLWGTGRIARRLETLRAATSKVLDSGSREPFREVNNRVVPLAAAAAAAATFATTSLLRDGWTPGLLRGATWLVVGIPLWTFLWTYVSLHLGLDRLGREHLRPGAAHVDPSLGLRPLGDVAFMGLWMLLVWLVPVLLTGLPEAVGIVIGLFALAAGLGTFFFFSLFRLHRQMTEVKASELATARKLYAEAYEPVRTEQTLEALDRQQRLLSAADGLEKRAHEINEWPIDEGTWARVVTIATSVVAITLARLILDPLGL